MKRRGLVMFPAAALAFATVAAAQQSGPLSVGTAAPDFALAGATKDGVLPKAMHLKDFRGQTVVLAFFYKARTKG
ncbi:MAG: hypothetical protein AB7L66_22220 [Gemmatimonadales bacterium]